MRLSSFADRYVSERVKPFFFLSYPVPNSPPVTSPYWSRHYGAGPDDAYLLLGWGVVLVVLRWISLALFRSFARWWLSSASSLNRASGKKKGRALGNGDNNHANGVASLVAPNGHAAGNEARLRTSQQSDHSGDLAPDSQRHRINRVSRKALAARERTATRFAEQGAVFVYYTFAWLFGVWVNLSIYGGDWLNADLFWELYPHTPLPSPIKAYYFLAFAFYTTQLVILNIEEHRRDHWQMLSHHFITVGLIAYSYFTHLTRPGCATLVLLDWCDIFLPFAKMSKYLNIPLAPDILFVVFLVSWFITRQVLLMKIILSVTFDAPRKLDLIWDPSRNLYFNRGSHLFFAVSLWLLYAMLCVWFWMGCKVAYNVVRGRGAEDTRSDAEESDNDGSSSSLSTTRSKED